jgi:hypothetical protein
MLQNEEDAQQDEPARGFTNKQLLLTVAIAGLAVVIGSILLQNKD